MAGGSHGRGTGLYIDFLMFLNMCLLCVNTVQTAAASCRDFNRHEWRTISKNKKSKEDEDEEEELDSEQCDIAGGETIML